MDMMEQIIDPAKVYMKVCFIEFSGVVTKIQDAVRFVRRSTKPDKKEFQKIAFATGKSFNTTWFYQKSKKYHVTHVIFSSTLL